MIGTRTSTTGRRRAFPAAAAIACLMSAQTATAQSFTSDFVFVVDESGSLAEEQSGVARAVAGLDTTLSTFSSGNRYGLVGFGSATETAGRSIPVGGGLFGTAPEFETAAQDLRLDGGTEDGYSGLDLAFRTYGPELRNEAERFVVIVTDEDRDILDNAVTRQTILDAAAAQNVSINGGVEQSLLGPGGESLVAVFENEAGDLVGFARQPDGDLVQVEGATFGPAFGTTRGDYVDLILQTGGVVLDVSQFDEFGDVAGELLITSILLPALSAQTDAIQSGILTQTGEQMARTNLRTVRTALAGLVTDAVGFDSLRPLRGGLATTGLSGGEAGGFDPRVSLYLDGDRAFIDDEFDNTPADGRETRITGYLNYQPSAKLLLGAILGYQSASYSLPARSGSRSSEGFAFGAHAHYNVAGPYVIGGHVLLSQRDNDIDERRLLLEVSAEGTDSLRGQAEIGVTRFGAVGPVELRPSLSIAYAFEKFDDYTASDGRRVTPDDLQLLQIVPRVEAGYRFGGALEGFEIVGHLAGEIDIVNEPNDDEDIGLVAGATLQVTPNDSVSYGVRAQKLFLRDDVETFNVGGFLNFTF